MKVYEDGKDFTGSGHDTSRVFHKFIYLQKSDREKNLLSRKLFHIAGDH
jgi:hypothetical protein